MIQTLRKFILWLVQVSWEFKWKSEDVELHGPHTSQKMLDWQVGDFEWQPHFDLYSFSSLRILTIQRSSHSCSISLGVWLLWRRDSCQKSWHRGVQGFKEDWFWALCLASFLDYPLFCKLGKLCTYWRDNPVSYLSTFQRNECTANLWVLPALWWREKDH